jgi:WD40 repeat protein
MTVHTQLLAITATLYYTTYSSSTFSYDQISNVSQLGAISRLTTTTPDAGLDKEPTARNMWKTINPAQTPLLHLRIEEPIVVTLTPDIDQSPPTKLPKLSRPRFSTGTFRLILWLFKIVVLPIAATTSLLWGLLLYLLKNAELLEARNPGGLEPLDPQDDKQTLENQISFSTLPRAFSSDVELIAASTDGKVVVSVGLHNEIIIWRVDARSHVSIDAADVLLRTASSSSAVSTLTCVTVDDCGSYCAVGTGAGVIALWALEEDRVHPLPILSLDMFSARVTELRFYSSATEMGHSLLATYENGVAAKWYVGEVPMVTYINPSSRASVVRSSLVCVDPVERYLIAFCLDDGTLELIDAHAADVPAFHPFIQPDYYVQAGLPGDLPSKVHACQAELAGSTQLVIAVATEGGRISLWDGLTAECIAILDETYGRINSLRVTPVQCETCHFCGQLPLESLSVAFSVDHVIRFFKLYLNDQTRRCACLRNTLHKVSSRDNVGRRSRSNSTSSQLGSMSPSLTRARPARPSEASAFPVSGHGVHSRRASEKETGRRSLETLTIPVLGEEQEPNNLSPTDPLGCKAPAYSFASFWRDAVVVRVTDITCERGGWGVNGTKAVGVRRKPRTQLPHQTATTVQIKPAWSQGLTAATLERWELWMFDPAASHLQSSLLADLTKNVRKLDHSSMPSSRSRSSTDPIPRLPFTRVSPFLIASSHVLAGFGNTVGVFSFASP